MSTSLENLRSRVRGVNLAGYVADEWFPKLAEAFRPFVGQKIVKADGSLTVKVKKQIDALNLPSGRPANIYNGRTDHSLRYVVTTCESSAGSAYYHDLSMYIGEMRDGVLTSILEKPDFPQNYDAATVTENRKAYERAREALREAEANLYPFGALDR